MEAYFLMRKINDSWKRDYDLAWACVDRGYEKYKNVLTPEDKSTRPPPRTISREEILSLLSNRARTGEDQ